MMKNLTVNRGIAPVSGGGMVSYANQDVIVFDPDSSFFVEAFNENERDLYSGFVEWDGAWNEIWDVTGGVRLTLVDMEAGEIGAVTSIPNGGAVPPPAVGTAPAGL